MQKISYDVTIVQTNGEPFEISDAQYEGAGTAVAGMLAAGRDIRVDYPIPANDNKVSTVIIPWHSIVTAVINKNVVTVDAPKDDFCDADDEQSEQPDTTEQPIV